MKGDNGWIVARLKYVRDAQNKLNRSIRNTSISSTALNESHMNNCDKTDTETAANDVIFLKSLVMCENNMEVFLEKLNSTREHRAKMLLDKKINLKEAFPYFFTHPQMVARLIVAILFRKFGVRTNYSFQILKEFELANPEINATAFIDKWTMFGPQLRDILTNHYKVQTFTTDWPKDVEDILVLLKMFPARQVGRNVIASDTTFKKSVDQLIHYEPVIHFTFIKYDINSC